MSAECFDRCRAAMSVVGITAPEQSVLLVLAVMANADGECWPGINGATGLTGKTKLSERTVQRAVQGLKDAGHINWIDKPGKGRTYTVHPRQSDAPTPVTVAPVTVTPPSESRPTPVTVAPKQPRTTIQGVTGASAKATRIPVEWIPEKPLPSEVAKLSDDWPPGRYDRELAGFRDYWIARNRDAARTDWDRTWWNRIRDQHDKIMRDRTNAKLRSNRGPATRSGDGFIAALHEASGDWRTDH